MLWVLGGYAAGTLPSTYLVARARGATDLIGRSYRGGSEGDAHVLMIKHLGGRWYALSAAMDVAKGFAYPLLARHAGGLGPEWLALVGVAVVVGHGWPPYARSMAGRGLSAAAGVLLALLPWEMAVAGAIIVVGIVFRVTGPASTIGLALVGPIAAAGGEPGPLVAMAVAILVVIMARRVEGVREVMRRRGTSWPVALYHRAVWDLDGPPLRPTAGRG